MVKILKKDENGNYRLSEGLYEYWAMGGINTVLLILLFIIFFPLIFIWACISIGLDES